MYNLLDNDYPNEIVLGVDLELQGQPGEQQLRRRKKEEQGTYYDFNKPVKEFAWSDYVSELF